MSPVQTMKKHSPKFWAWVILMGWIFVIAGTFAPTSLWVDFRAVSVVGLNENGCPVLEVDRRIHITSPGRWYVDLQRAKPMGQEGFYQYRHGQGPAIYGTADALPDPLTLDWWMGLPEEEVCNLPAGVYRLDHLWIFDTPGQLVDKRRLLSSPTFTVPSPPPKALPYFFKPEDCDEFCD